MSKRSSRMTPKTHPEWISLGRIRLNVWANSAFKQIGGLLREVLLIDEEASRRNRLVEDGWLKIFLGLNQVRFSGDDDEYLNEVNSKSVFSVKEEDVSTFSRFENGIKKKMRLGVGWPVMVMFVEKVTG
ncbi:hypothetical protein LWI28_026334 [Acer negundo]|uniref:Uncharacterized protein n=1 Tax=Acer negundo TaxID=4023 RepID=A0AAD5NJ22_ACENE|nr:hypothetical protein LWI28_026334 [Acer negundo]